MRLIACVLILALLASLALPLAPAAAMTTAKEVAIGQSQSQQIDDENIIYTDPFLMNWVQGIGARLAANRYRTDITYRFEVLDDSSINAFALPGGFLHADMGLLNFVGSDDELAEVLGHEMGHVERRHVITLNEKGDILAVLIGVLSILSPIAYAFGGYGGDLTMNKLSREDELQADQYGLLLMSRAGYDPESAVDLMAHLGKLEEGGPQPGKSDQWMEDHPEPKDRIAHLLGYPELNNPSASSILADAIHDQEEGRYSYAQVRLQLALKKAPNNTLALAHLDEVESALKYTDINIAMQKHGQPAPSEERAVANALAVDALSIGDLANRLTRAQAVVQANTRLATQRSRDSRSDVETLFNSLEGQTSATPNLGSPKTKTNNLGKAILGLQRLTKDINGTLDTSQDVLGSAPDLASENLEPLKEMENSIATGPPSDKTRDLLPYYPQLASNLSESSDQILNGVDDARAAVSMANDSVKLLANFLGVLNAADTSKGDISDKDMPKIQSALDAATTAWDAALAMAQRASTLAYGGQTTTLSANITLLDLYSSSERYDYYRKAIAFRLPGVTLPDYQTAVNSGILPGELGCDAWISYETKQSVSQLLSLERSDGSSCADVAIQQNLFGESMEIAEGLLYEDYIEVPEKV
ncbi:MAG TPA: M48 family metalloprotease [Candidatus Acidoferrales bacterium]|nr:M48 family metalloprotease [Candidatus Acidoferrales bacterium]